MMSMTRIVRGATVISAVVTVVGCHVFSRARPAATPDTSQYDMAVIRLQHNREVAGFIDKLDGVDVAHYLRGLGPRPTLPEIGIEPGTHTIDVGYFDVKTRTIAAETVGVTWSAQAGHLYEIRITPRSLLSKAEAVLTGDHLGLHAWVDDKGPVDGKTVLWWQAPTPARRQPPHPKARKAAPKRKARRLGTN